MKKWIKWTLTVLFSILTGLWLLVYAITYHPSAVQPEEISCNTEAPNPRAGQTIKVLNWNVQYMGSRKHVFWYDISAELRQKGEIKTIDTPSKEDVIWTLDEVARIIKSEDPDIVLLQEVDRDSDRTHNINQIDELLKRLPGKYKCHSDAWYWKADFVPHPRVLGAVGMQVATLSKYKIESASRHQLALIPEFWLTQQFNLKRAVLETRFSVDGGNPLVLLNTHMSAFSQGSNTMENQVKQVHTLLQDLQKEGVNWMIGGDFNLLPPGVNKNTIHPTARFLYKDKSEITMLFNDFKSTVSKEQLQSPNRSRYFTHTPNNPLINGMDRTIDYIFYADSLPLVKYRVRQKDTQKISDHLPMIAEFRLPVAK